MKAVLMSIKPKWCEKIFNGEKTVEVRTYIPFGLRGFELFPEWLKEMCLSKEQLDKYGGLKTLYGLHITAPKLYDKPKELSEFRKPDEPFHTVEINENGNIGFCDGYIDGKPITRPPQSWQYVEELC